MTDKTAYITVKFVEVKNQPKDVIFEVYSWNRQGEPAPSATLLALSNTTCTHHSIKLLTAYYERE